MEAEYTTSNILTSTAEQVEETWCRRVKRRVVGRKMSFRTEAERERVGKQTNDKSPRQNKTERLGFFFAHQ